MLENLTFCRRKKWTFFSNLSSLNLLIYSPTPTNCRPEEAFFDWKATKLECAVQKIPKLYLCLSNGTKIYLISTNSFLGR